MSVLEEIKALYEEKQRDFEAYKKTNDERLKKLEEGKAVAEVEEKLAKIDASMSERDEKIAKQFAELKRIGNTTQDKTAQETEVKSGFNKLLRSGSAARMTQEEIEALAKKQS